MSEKVTRTKINKEWEQMEDANLVGTQNNMEKRENLLDSYPRVEKRARVSQQD